ncbi:uncharacterized protein EI90DRAFT_3087966 [Cantharellus anzutake]|uniref:uncharacterized protein n=1 Tax=Cantharellus anzutake TaxID=1750568 RepID=UPI00190872C4|nr:uncharacterized protein EI90DRAFT_3087966 [Cantharellus anzutake]KAF8315536.1 hypothetical protein EI90DRAFT_3087966 [Cantharellus anzutake]
MSLKRAIQDEVTDREVILRASAIRGVQIASLVAPPQTLLTANRILRATWVSSGVGGAVGAASGFYQGTQSPTALREHQQQLTYDVNRIRAQDYSIIGSVLSTPFITAFLWRRARLIHLILGGAGLGTGAGYGYHIWRFIMEGGAPPGTAVPLVQTGAEEAHSDH